MKDTSKIQMQSVKNFAASLGFVLNGNHFTKTQQLVGHNKYQRVSINTMVVLHNQPISAHLIKRTLEGLGINASNAHKYREALAEKLVETAHIVYNKRKKEVQVTSHIIKIL